ncbi:hypothetical protein EPA93_16630 [Ktedonosporobacter rubrisoli]|uniref:HTH luxR-type domain-containing protein n=1 Tax=Ktedonosporobacter rubrisoli TaxID=2509675 RepID=A0A4P6JQ47_KTERU|nr:LuxR C-terminal-related transcriptional regulator [Ktedonosporobacter rubrisoli]QBD77528.1 hypothetical protein EPA93_16630 [Ktedonosporobacter rubrisoli]
MRIVPGQPLAEESSVSNQVFPASNPDGLTAREVEVIRVVAEGLANEQVAEHLIINPRMIDTRLTLITA